MFLLTVIISLFIKNILHTAKLEKREFVLCESQKVAHIGSFIIDIENNKWVRSAELDRILGINETYNSTLDSFINIIHPDWKSEIINYISLVYYEKRRFNYQYKIIRIIDGAECWVHMLGELGYDSNGKISNMIGNYTNKACKTIYAILLKK
jgi:hypothetical protein